MSLPGFALNESLFLDFDVNAFSLQAVQKACHRFTDIASFEVQILPRGEKNSIVVTARALGVKSEEGMAHLEKRLRNEALEQQLREQIRGQTEGLRNLILAHAFSKTGLIAPDGAPPAA